MTPSTSKPSRLFVAATVVFALTSTVIGSSVAHPSAQDADTPRAAAPPVTVRDAKGAAVTLADYRGKVVLLDFWATWCAGCKREIPWFIEFDQKYRAQGLVSIGMAMDDEGWKTVTPYLAEHPIPYRIVMGDADVAKRFQITNLPVTLLIDRAGRIAEQHVGVVDQEAWDRKIQQLLQERAH